jgi:nucleoside-diphosphate-sugar epimerase
MEKETILITGSSGYVGALLVHKLSKQENCLKIIGVDKNLPPLFIKDNPKFHFIHKNTTEDWESEVKQFNPTTVVHAAWQIRELVGQKGRDLQRFWNLNGSHQVFDFVFTAPSVKKIIHFSSIASYGAFSGNRQDVFFNENDPLRVTGYSYADEKKEAEKMLNDLYNKYEDHKTHLPQVYILRPASITGPFGKNRGKFGLQSVLLGKANENFLSKIISKILFFTPVTPAWCRQFIHEDDVVSIVDFLSFNKFPGEYEVFNICPQGDIVNGQVFAEILNKKAVSLPPSLIRVVFALAWKCSFGKIATPPGSWRTYSYPIAVDGSKLNKLYGYKYLYETKDAFTTGNGAFADLKN